MAELITESIELKHCPFCGRDVCITGHPRIRRYLVYHSDITKRNRKECIIDSLDIYMCDSIEEAMEKWNRRADNGA